MATGHMRAHKRWGWARCVCLYLTTRASCLP